MRCSRALAGAAATALALLAGAGCGDSAQDPIRIGVLVDCTGIVAEAHDWALAAAELALIHRGAQLSGKGPGGGVRGATVSGRAVELVEGCSESGVYGRLVVETRKLVEVDHVDAVIGAFGWTDGVVFRELARRYPTVPFLLAGSYVREATAHVPAPNLYRFTPDVEQEQAGLATYAYRTLGWRRAVTVGEDAPNDWGAVAAFSAEFCALGGSVDAVWTPAFGEAGPLLRQVPTSADGVMVFAHYGAGSPVAFIRAYLARHPDGARRLLLGVWIFNPAELPAYKAAWPELRGVVASLSGLPDPTSASDSAYDAAFRREFPGLPASAAHNRVVEPYYTAMDAVLRSLEKTRGALGAERIRLRDTLATLRLETPSGPVRLDRNRQAVAPVTLVRLERAAPGRLSFRPVRRIPSVDQTLGGLLDADASPTRETPACRRSALPPWAG